MNQRTHRSRYLEQFRGALALAAVIGLWLAWPPRDADGVRMLLSPAMAKDIFFEQAIYGLLAAGMTVVILTGGIDLSVGSVLGLCATSFSALLMWRGWPTPLAFAATMGIGALAGVINGTLVARLRMQPFAATLAMMVIARGIAKWVTHNEKVQSAAANPAVFEQITNPPAPFLPPTLVLLTLLVFAALHLVVARTQFGRYLYSVGANAEAARLSGLNVALITTAAYALCGLCAALAGIGDAARQTLGDPEAGLTFELDAIAAVVIGGTSLRGGRGGVTLTLVGLMIVGIVDKLLSMHGMDLSIRLMAKGVIIVAAVLIQGRTE